MFSVSNNLNQLAFMVDVVLIALILFLLYKLKSVREDRNNSNKYLETLIETAPDALICSNIKGEIIRVNNQAELMFGYTRSELLNLKISDLIPDDVKANHKNLTKEYFNKPIIRHMGESENIRVKIKSGDVLDVDISLSYFELNNKKIVVSSIRDVSQLRKTNRKLAYLATHDPLTGLYNRTELNNLLDKEFTRAERYKRELSIFMVDIDYFKKVNDTYGHIFGDITLKSVARSIQKTIRLSDLCARFGGEEFIILLPETPSSDAFSQAERLRKSIEECVISDDEGNKTNVTVSIGIASYPENGNTIDDLLKNADLALYKAKSNGRNRTETS